MPRVRYPIHTEVHTFRGLFSRGHASETTSRSSAELRALQANFRARLSDHLARGAVAPLSRAMLRVHDVLLFARRRAEWRAGERARQE